MADPLPQDLYAAFRENVTEHGLWEPDDRLLVAVSGGPDSVVLADLTRQTGQLAGLVHVNYHLRGRDSQADQDLVRDLSDRWGTPFYLLDSSPEALSELRGVSTQMAARQIRYDWWGNLIDTGAGSCVLTAHHADDQLETILLHWLRGTGMTGWLGIPMKRSFLRRPLLPFRKDTLMAYADWAGLTFRTDQSNLGDHYKRNQIRHHILPELLAIQPELHQIADRQTEDARHILQAANWSVQKLEELCLSRTNHQIRINLQPLRSIPWSSYALYQWLHPLGFSRDQLQAIASLDDQAHGQQFHSDHWEAVVDRGHLLCRPRQLPVSEETGSITATTQTVTIRSGQLTIEQVFTWNPSDLDDPNILLLDRRLLTFPLTLRTWAPGDRMRLPGVTGRKKIKAILAEQRMDPFQKRDIPVLYQEIDQQVLWLPGYRVSADASLPDRGSEGLKLTWTPSKH
ncbi:MAG: tRNA lysidine(34) synthetase TilS [Lewinellaceae bacterium]|nr:tRNA lysidine(34) synthetase TilS [Lewinellaceae bacterium]